MSRTVLMRVLAGALGVVTAVLWHYANAEVIGYMALSRIPDLWPTALRVGVPVLIFLAVVVLSYWLFIRILGRTAVPAIWAAVLAYVALMIHAHLTVPAGSLELTLSALLVCAAAIPGIAAVRFAKRPATRT
jgi:hypothetical protein